MINVGGAPPVSTPGAAVEWRWSSGDKMFKLLKFEFVIAGGGTVGHPLSLYSRTRTVLVPYSVSFTVLSTYLVLVLYGVDHLTRSYYCLNDATYRYGTRTLQHHNIPRIQ